jgi:hypothetical protein
MVGSGDNLEGVFGYFSRLKGINSFRPKVNSEVLK